MTIFDNEVKEKVNIFLFIGRKIAQNPLIFLIGAYAAGVTIFGLDWGINTPRKIIEATCSSTIENTELKCEIEYTKKLEAYKWQNRVSTGKILKSECDNEKTELGEAFNRAISSAIENASTICNERLEKCQNLLLSCSDE